MMENQTATFFETWCKPLGCDMGAVALTDDDGLICTREIVVSPNLGFLKSIHDCKYYLRTPNDKNVIATAEIANFVNPAHFAYGSMLIRNIGIGKEYRGKGIGRFILNSTAKIAKDADCSDIKLCSVAGVTGFYKKLGFEFRDSLLKRLRDKFSGKALYEMSADVDTVLR